MFGDVLRNDSGGRGTALFVASPAAALGEDALPNMEEEEEEELCSCRWLKLKVGAELAPPPLPLPI